MIGREDFKMIMNKIIKNIEVTSELYQIGIDIANSKFTLLDVIVYSLSRCFTPDTEAADIINEWYLGYWLFELNCGRDYTDGCVTDANGNIIKFETLDEVYDEIVNVLKEMEE